MGKAGARMGAKEAKLLGEAVRQATVKLIEGPCQRYGLTPARSCCYTAGGGSQNLVTADAGQIPGAVMPHFARYCSIAETQVDEPKLPALAWPKAIGQVPILRPCATQVRQKSRS